MRISDILKEEVLKAPSVGRPGNSKYIANLINLINQGAEIQVTLPKTKATGRIVKTVRFLPQAAANLSSIWNPSGDKSEAPTAEQLTALFSANLPAEDGNDYRLTHIEKTADITQKVGTEGEKTYSKYWNIGDLAEGIMSTAVLTKFENEGAVVTAAQVFENVQRMTQVAPGEVIYETQAFGKKIELRAQLKKQIIEALLQSASDPDEFLKYKDSKEVYKLYSDCATYVNQSNSVKSAIEKIKNADTKDVIQVTADGATPEAQHSTKADLWIALNNKKEKLLSIKTATVKHIGGHAGYEFHKIDTFLSSVLGFNLPDNIKSKFKTVPLQFSKKTPPTDEAGNLLFPDWKPGDPPPEGYLFFKEREPIAKAAREYNVNHGIKDAYKYCDTQLKRILASPEGEAQFVKSVVDGVVYHATLGEDVRVVVISPNAKEAFKELDFGPDFRNAMNNFDLTHVYEETEKEGKKIFKLKIYGYPKTNIGKKVISGASMLVQLRTYNQDNATRNVVEIGDLLKKITDVTALENLDNKSEFNTRAKPLSQAELKKLSGPTTSAKKVPQVPATNQQAVSSTANTQSIPPQTTTAPDEVIPDEEDIVTEHANEIIRMLQLIKY